jgi:DNA polymerase-3 subunit beta
VKITASAGELAGALALAAALADDARTRKIQALGAIRLTAIDAGVEIAGNVLDHALTLTAPATIETAGALALPGGRLAALAAGCPRESQIEIAADGTGARVLCGRSRFRLPAIPQDHLPAPLSLKTETERVELAREEALKLFAQPLFAVTTEETRYYLNGVFLHDIDEGLAAVGTDGQRLCRVIIRGVVGLSRDRGLIVPRAAVKIIIKLLGDKSCERIVLRHSATLFAVEAARFAFVSKLVDGTFPDYARLLPSCADTAVTVAKADLAPAVERIAAVVDPAVKTSMQMVGLQWSSDESALHLRVPGHDDLADDVIDAEAAGVGKVAMRILHLRDLIDELPGARIRLDTNGGMGPILVTNPDNPHALAVQMPCVWPFEKSEAAA